MRTALITVLVKVDLGANASASAAARAVEESIERGQHRYSLTTEDGELIVVLGADATGRELTGSAEEETKRLLVGLCDTTGCFRQRKPAGTHCVLHN